MSFGDIETMREEGNLRLLKTERKYGSFSYLVIGGGHTRQYADYEDALDEFNERWMKALYGDSE